MKIYCIDINNSNYEKIRKLNYIPVGLGKDNFNKNWLRDNTGENISSKNPYYGEYTFHYWLWKNQLKSMNDNEWVGFCAYRRFWSNNKKMISTPDNNNFLTNIPVEWNDYDTILGQQFFINKI